MRRTTTFALSTASLSVAFVAALTLTPATAGASGPAVRSVVAPGFGGRLTQVASESNGDLWALGSTIGDTTLILHRHGTKWHRANAPAVGSDGAINAIGAGGNEGWVGGYRQTKATKDLPPHDVPVVAVSDAGGKFTFQKLPAPDGEVEAIAASSADNAWAVGNLDDLADVHYETEHWNGSKWESVPLPGTTMLTAVATSSATNTWAIDEHDNVWQWDGESWTKSFTPPKAVTLRGIATDASNDTVAVGEVNTSKTQSYIAEFDGKKWKRVGSPDPHSYTSLGSVALQNGAAWAVGRSAQGRSSFSVILHRHGDKWKTQKSPIGEGAQSELSSVTALTAKTAFAVGYYGQTNDDVQSAFAVYRNGKWKDAASTF